MTQKVKEHFQFNSLRSIITFVRNEIYELPSIVSKNTSHSFLLSVYITT